MADVFTTTDPLGRVVSCSEKTWYSHVEVGHPIFKGKADFVKQVIENPDVIYPSGTHANRTVYFGAGIRSEEVTCVIVENNDIAMTGDVVTAINKKGIGGNIDESRIIHIKSKL